MIQQMHLLLGNSIIPIGQRIVITLGHNTNFYKEFYDLHYKLVLKINLISTPHYSRGRKHVLFYFIALSIIKYRVHLAYKGEVFYKVVK